MVERIPRPLYHKIIRRVPTPHIMPLPPQRFAEHPTTRRVAHSSQSCYKNIIQINENVRRIVKTRSIIRHAAGRNG